MGEPFQGIGEVETGEIPAGIVCCRQADTRDRPGTAGWRPLTGATQPAIDMLALQVPLGARYARSSSIARRAKLLWVVPWRAYVTVRSVAGMVSG